jgi:hypothetical protein
MRNLTKLTAILLLLAVSFNSCKKDLQDLIENDLVFNMDANAFLQNQVQFQFLNANGTNASAPKPSISISGKDAGLVFDINGGKEFKLDGQFARMVVSPGNPLSAENPALFKVRAEAPGFLPYEQELAITQLDSFMTYTLEMVELKNAPEGIRYFNSSTKVDGKIKIGDNNANGFSASVSMPADNAVMDATGNRQAVSKIELVQFDGNKQAVAAKMPNLIPNFTDKISYMNTVEEVSFFPVGYAQMNINGRQEQMNFEKGTNVSFNLERGTVDPLSNNVLNAGDAMQVYQWDAVNANWKFIQDATLQNTADGGLTVDATVFNTAVIALVVTPPSTPLPISGATCRSNLGLQFRRSSNVNTRHLVMVIAANDSSKVYAIEPNVIIANNTTFNIGRRLPSNIQLQVIVYEYETYALRGRQVLVSTPFRSCDFTTSRRLQLTVNPPTVTNRKIARFELDTYCPTSRLFYYHEGRIEYRVKSNNPSAPWFDLGLARRSGSTVTQIVNGVPSLPPVATSAFSFLETDRLENGVTYEFRVTITGTPRRVRGLPNSSVTETFVKTRKFDETEFESLRGTSPAGYNFLKFKRSYWLANSDTNPDPCALWRY